MSPEYRPPVPPTRRTGRILLGLWAFLTLSQLAYVLAYGHNQPWADEWEFVPVLTGNEPPVPFLMQPHNEHRLPLPRLIYLGLWANTHDFRLGMVLQVIFLAAMAWRGMRLAAHLRGVPSLADAFFPLTLLHVGHCENLMMGYQLCFALASTLSFQMLELALRLTRANAPRTTLLAALVALALSLCGGFGIVLAAPIAAWVAVLLVRNWKRSPIENAATVLSLLATAAYVGYYLATYERPAAHPPFDPGNWLPSLEVAGEFLAVSFGIGIGPVWFVVLPLVLIAFGIAVRAGLKSRTAWRPLGVAAVAVGVVLLALAVGAGRGGFGSPHMGLWPRYSVLGWPLLAAIYLTGLIHRHGLSRGLPPALAIGAALALLPNTLFGLDFGQRHDAWLSDIARQWREGEPAEEIVERSLKGTGQEDRARRGIPMLHAAKIGPFADWKPSP